MTDSPSRSLFFGTSGPQAGARIAIVGEAWGVDEATAQRPFVGASGRELDRMLAEVGIRRDECFATNCIAARPADNQMWRFFAPREAATESLWGLHPTAQLRTELTRLWAQLDAIRPQVILAVGNYALWALTSEARLAYRSADADGNRMEGGGRVVPSGIADFRGSMLYSRPRDGLPTYRVLPIIHPAAIMREWSWRAITIHDLKTRIPLALANDWEPRNKPVILFRPTVQQALDYFQSRLAVLNSRPLRFSIDLETTPALNNQRVVTCISFCSEPGYALTVPLLDKRDGKFRSYWNTPTEEARVVQAMLRLIAHPNFGAIGQNFLYDQSYMLEHWGVVPRLAHDTMLAHHMMFPGTPKDLGHLSSIYCKYHRFWKDDNREWDAKQDINEHLLYNGEDALRTLEIAQTQAKLIDQLGRGDHWAEELEAQELAFEMMRRGVRIDTAARSALQIELMELSAARQRLLLNCIPQAWVDTLLGAPQKNLWIFSPIQQQVVFYQLLGLPVQRNRKTGNASLDTKALAKLRDKFPIFGQIFIWLEELRSIGVYWKTFINAKLDPDGRLRCSFNTGGTETFRWSSSANPFGRGTNLQNIPRDKN